MNKNIFDDLKLAVKEYLNEDTSGHDYYHAERVFNSALNIHSKEGGDLLIIGCAALTHDICRPWEKKTGKSHFGSEALEIIRKVLNKVSLSDKNINSILEVIKYHDIYDWTEKNNNKSLELKIIQDADNLDAMGAIGIARTFVFGASHGLQIYTPGENLDFTNDFVDDPNHKTSTIAHFYEKLLKLKDNMNTNTGKKLAQGRHDVMENYLKNFFSEWEGKS